MNYKSPTLSAYELSGEREKIISQMYSELAIENGKDSTLAEIENLLNNYL